MRTLVGDWRADIFAASKDGASAVLLAAKTRNERALEAMLGAGQCQKDAKLGEHVVKARMLLSGGDSAGLLNLIAQEFSSFHKIVATLLLKHGPQPPARGHRNSFEAWQLHTDKDLGATVHPAGGTTVASRLLQLVRRWTARLVGKVLLWCAGPVADRLIRSKGSIKQTVFHASSFNGDNETLFVLLGASRKPGQVKQRLASQTKHGMTPLHLAASRGHVHAAALLMNEIQELNEVSRLKLLEQADAWGRRASDLALSPRMQNVLAPAIRGSGSSSSREDACVADAGCSADDTHPGCTNQQASSWWGTRTRPPWQHSHVDSSGVSGGGSGSNTDNGSAGNGASQCDIDVVNATALETEAFVRDYLLVQKPVLIRGGANAWPAREKWTLKHFTDQHSQHPVQPGAIPFAAQYGFAQTRTTLGAFIAENMGRFDAQHAAPPAPSNHEHMYVFENKLLAPKSSLLQDIRLPPWFGGMKMHPLQFMLGPRGSGSPAHFHISAWNALVFGQKQWFLLPPSRPIFSKVPALKWAASLDASNNRSSGHEVARCIQDAGVSQYTSLVTKLAHYSWYIAIRHLM